MSSKNTRKPLALAAIVASSIGSALAGAGAANATTYGGPGQPNPVTITSGGAINVVGGGKVALPAGAHDVSWAGQAGRFAYIGADNAIYTADFDGTHVIKIAQGIAPSHTVWDAYNEVVYWTEGTGATAKVVGAVATGDGLDSARPTFDPITTPPASLGLSSPDVAADAGQSIVVQTTDASGNTGISVSSWDITTGKQSVTQIVAPGDAKTGGSAPTISPDGTSVVFVRTDANGDTQLFQTSLKAGAWSTPKQITWETGNHSTPIYEGLGNTVAFEYTNRTPTPAGTAVNGTYQVDVTAALAATAPAPELEKNISTLTGGLAVRTEYPGHVYRFAGADRIDTAIQASRQNWKTNGSAADHRIQAQSVVLSRSDLFADALGGSALAAHKDGPLLLTGTAKLDAQTEAEIKRILPAGSPVYLLGGTAAISPAVQAKLVQDGYKVDRIAGKDRFETAIDIANAVDPNASDVLVATGTNYPDALSAGAAAGALPHTVVVLTDGSAMPTVTNTYLQGKANSGQLKGLAAVGGAANSALKAAKWEGYDPLFGNDRYQTSYMVAHEIFGSFAEIGVATGANWPDSLSGGALMGWRQGPLLLVDPTVGLTAADDALIDANRGADQYAYVFGGPNALPLTVDKQLAADIATSVGSATGPGHAAAPAAGFSTPNVKQG